MPPALLSLWNLSLLRIYKKSFSLWIFREYPPITSDQQRQLYKRSFDTGLQEYKSLQAELDEVNKELSRLDKELDDYREESEEYMVNSNLIIRYYIEFYSSLWSYIILYTSIDTDFASNYQTVISLNSHWHQVFKSFWNGRVY